MPASFNEILFAFESTSMEGMGEHQAYICRQSGKIYFHSDLSEFQQLNDELPDDIEDEEKYLQLPDKYELNLGKPLVLAFAREFLPNDVDEVRRIFSKRGAYANFKSLLAKQQVIDRWHDFQDKATERALREWCDLHDIKIVD
jgi:uncharacterized protein UPF0158